MPPQVERRRVSLLAPLDDDSFVHAKAWLHPLNSTDCPEENSAPDLSPGVGGLPPDCTDFNFGFTATGMTG